MKHIHPIQLRFADTDALGHINNSAYALYIESARVGFLVATGLPVGSLVLARLEIDYKMQVEFDAHASFTDPTKGLVVESQVERIGKTSMTLRQHIMWKGQLAADVRTVVVNFDYTTNAPSVVSEEIRDLLEPYLVG
ncbi:MAG: acyl-CoA thioesterase [Saprospiraceae bacterium]